MILQRLLILCLTCALTLTSGVSHVRASDGPAVAQVVLCINGMSQKVWVDAQGTPTSPDHSCAHCILGAVVAPDMARITAPLPQRTVLDRPLRQVSLAQVLPRSAQARAPPLLVS